MMSERRRREARKEAVKNMKGLRYHESVRKAMASDRRLEKKRKKEEEARLEIVRVRQGAFEDGFKQGRHRGEQDATVAVRAQAFSDLSNVWGQVAIAHKAAGQYADIMARMYLSKTNIRKADDTANTPSST